MLAAIIRFFGFDRPPPTPSPPERRRAVAVPAPPPWSRADDVAAIKAQHLARPLELSRAVRYVAYDALDAKAKKAKSMGTLGRSDPRKSAHVALGPERLSYIRCRQILKLPLPLLADFYEGVPEHECLYERRLDRDVRDDLDTWEAGRRVVDAQTADAKADGLPGPEPLRIPLDVELALARRAAARLEAAEKRWRRGGGTDAGKAGGGGAPAVVSTEPKDDEPAASTPSAGPK